MKKILKISSLAFLLIAGVACENDDQRIIQAEGGPELISPATGTEFVLTPENAASEATTLVWNHADYSQQTAVNYDIEVALAGTEFATIVSGGTTNNRFYVWSVEALNTVALDAGLTPYTAGDLDIRVKASLGANDVLESYSNTITITVTPYTTETPKLWMPGSYQSDSGYGNNWTQSTAATLASEGFGNTNFEGYVYFANNVIADNDNGFKFSTQDNWDGINYGDDGTFSGALSATGSNIGLNAGYYRATVNTTQLTYNFTPMSWAVLGDATVGVTGGDGWGNNGGTDYDLTYNPATKKLTATIPLTAGEIKFRANNGWDVNLGDDGVDGIMEYGGANIAITTAGTYLIELDLSNPRQYTYTLTAQ